VLTTIQEKAQSPALESWYQDYHALVLNAAYRVTGKREDAEDVLQTIFTRLLANPRQLDPGENIQGYFYRAAIHGALDLLRHRHGIQPVELEEGGLEAFAAASGNPYHQFREQELADWLRQALLRCSPLAAEVFVLARFEGMDNREIARLVDTTPNSVAVLLHRIKEKLSKEFQKHLGGRS
jgi:RNA polymerase sigma-70 factor (ECF subfamily)